MNNQEYYERLDSTAGHPAASGEHCEQRSASRRPYHAPSDARHGVERGSVVVGEADAIVGGYPGVPRVLMLDTGVTSFFEAGKPGIVEENLNGFTVRIA